MPIHKAEKDGKEGWQFGEHGKVYTGPDAKHRAEEQMRAAIANGWKPGSEKKQ